MCVLCPCKAKAVLDRMAHVYVLCQGKNAIFVRGSDTDHCFVPRQEQVF